MSSLRSKILDRSPDFKEEKVTVPEWGETFIVRELSVKDRNAFVNSGIEQVEVAGGFTLVPKQDPLQSVRLVIAATFDENGERVFQDGDVEALASEPASTVDRLYRVAARLSGLAGNVDEEVDEAGKG